VSFSHPQVDPTLYDLHSSAKYKKDILKKVQ